MADQPKLQRRVVQAAETTLRTHGYVAPVDVLVGLGWLRSSTVEDWRRGRLSPLARALPVDAAKTGTTFEYLRNWARQHGLQPSEAGALAGTRDQRPLVFADDESLQRLFRTHWISPGLSDKQRAKLESRQNRAPELVVVPAPEDWGCDSCGARAAAGSLQFPEENQRLCLSCVDFDHLVFLPSGNAALSRRAKQESTLAVLVMRLNKRRK